MLILQVKLPPGYSDELKAHMRGTLTTVLAGTTCTDPSTISVAFSDVGPDSRHEEKDTDQHKSEFVDPASLVRRYLQAMEQRDLKSAQDFLADNFVMTFPGSGEMSTLSQLVEWSAGRYRRVEKSISAVNVTYETDQVVVFVHGTLAGEWPDGTAFDKVRFIDRFEIRDYRLERQDVWNDLANASP